MYKDRRVFLRYDVVKEILMSLEVLRHHKSDHKKNATLMTGEEVLLDFYTSPLALPM